MTDLSAQLRLTHAKHKVTVTAVAGVWTDVVRRRVDAEMLTPLDQEVALAVEALDALARDLESARRALAD